MKKEQVLIEQYSIFTTAQGALRACSYLLSVVTWTLTSQAVNMLAAAQTRMARSTSNIIILGQKNIWLREKTKVTDVTEEDRRQKTEVDLSSLSSFCTQSCRSNNVYI